MANDSCPGFDDLFRCARKRKMTAAESREFSEMSQDEKNEIVKRLVDETKGAFAYRDILWKDDQVYTAFNLVPGDGCEPGRD